MDKDIVSFKLISGEEIICHVNMNELVSTSKEVTLYDPYLIDVNTERSALMHWLHSTDKNNIPFPKSMIMFLIEPTTVYTEIYSSLIRKKYSMENKDKNIIEPEYNSLH